MTAAQRPMSPGDWALLVVLAALWGGSFFFVAIAVTGLPPLTIVLTRVTLGAALLGTIARVSGHAFPLDRRTWADFLVMGLFGNALPLALIVWGQIYIPSGLAAILGATMPLFTILIAHVMTRDDRLTGAKLAGVIVGIGGVVVLIGVDVLQDFGIHVVAQLAMLAAACSYGFGLAYCARLRHLPSTVLAVGQLCGAAVVVLPFALLFERPWLLPMPGWPVIGAILGLVVLSTAIAYQIYFRILVKFGATNASLVTFLVPISALILGMTMLGERLAPNHFAGMALIFAGLAVIDGRVWRMFGRLGPRPPLENIDQGRREEA